MKKLKKNYLIYLVVAVVVVIVAFLLRYKWTKNNIAQKYKVTKPTFNKWIKYFCPEIDYEQWLTLKKVPAFTYYKIIRLLGDQYHLALNKKQMCDEFSTNGKYLSKIVLGNQPELGITKEVWNSCSVFPPNKVILISSVIGV